MKKEQGMKRLLPILFFISMQFHAKAQFDIQYIHELGVGAAFNELVAYPNIQYSPRLNLYNFTSRSTISIDARVGVGYGMESGTYVQDNYPVLYVPGTINFNSGACATRTTDDYLGFYFGGGYGFENAWDNYIIHGPVINTGMRLYLGSSPFDLNVSYLFDITNQKAPIFGLGVHWVMNMLK